MNLLQDVGTWGVYASAGLTTVNVVGFGLLARFWRSRGGWHMFCDMFVLAWILDMLVLRILLGDTSWFMWLRTLSFALGLPAMLLWRAFIIFDLQVRLHPRDRRAYGGDRHRPDEEEKNAA